MYDRGKLVVDFVVTFKLVYRSLSCYLLLHSFHRILGVKS
jgi:hypothetical protein